MKRPTISRKDFQMQEIPDECPGTSYLDQEGFEEAKNSYENGDFYFVGIRASVDLPIPTGDGMIMQRITSPGLWGIESNCSTEYVNEVFMEESDTLANMLKALHVKVTC